MSTRRAAKRQRRLVVLSSEDEGDSNETEMTRNTESETEGADERGYVESKDPTSLERVLPRGTKRKNTPILNGAAVIPLTTRVSTATTTATVTAQSRTIILPTRPSQKPRQKQTQTQLPCTPQKRRRTQTRSMQMTPGSHPEKKRKRKLVNRQSESPSKSLHSFFARATDEERWSRKLEKDYANVEVRKSFKEEMDTVDEIEEEEEEEEEEVEEEEIKEDFIGDDSCEEIFTSQILGGGYGGGNSVQAQEFNNTSSQLDRRKEKGIKSEHQGAAAKSLKRPAKRFLLLPESLPAGPGPGNIGGQGPGRTRELRSSDTLPPRGIRPWAEEYAPVNLDELVVNKRKVGEVQKWLMDAFTGRSKRRVLVLRGPAGSGKSTTISLLSKAIGFEILEWKNPLGSEFLSQQYASMGAQFEDFLGRGDKFGSLTLAAAGQNKAKEPMTNGQTHSFNIRETRRVILIEEFPSSLSQTSSGLRTFRLAIQRYLAMAVPSQSIGNRLRWNTPLTGPPLIMIVSETMLGSGGISADSFTVHRLLGPELSNHPGTSIIDFNKIAPTFMTKALDLVLRKEARRSKRKRIPGPVVLKAFAEMGDVRSAISGLEFMCLRGDENGGWSGTVAGRMKKSGKGRVPLTSIEKESLEIVTQREASLGIFHAVGRVVYNKREDPTITLGFNAKPPQPPKHLQHHARPKVSEVSIDNLINETGTDLETFIAALHENYVLSCTGPSFTEYFENCISILSDTDILAPDGLFHNLQKNRGGIGSARLSYQGYGATIDMLRQDEISFQVAVRGLLFSLPFPVRRQAPAGCRTGDAYKMFFPTSMRLWRQTEEMDGLLDLWLHRLTDPTMDISSRTTIQRLEGVESWKNRSSMSGFSSHNNNHESSSDASSSAATRAMISRDEVLLERLPYLSLISRSPAEIQELEKITQFRGVSGQSDEEPGDVDFEDYTFGGCSAMELWSATADRAVASPQKRKRGAKLGQLSLSNSFAPKLLLPVEKAVEKLILSDDDIEDD
ncbi:uncharacterized protein PADG_00018 [Paracoccidioides brasiliensis Pb18]|uniref:Checkpoint protein RAD24-like helical bundle domain-containing protein n=1 Tax=Paracoccidioides brasiliensis (strain Pb18) TaxID=502780 RepID=C1FZH8_PARBD|nr:uncharacterized protein PADG_00018 [Paracoccidioides brasiliensis Pb18]EEH43729.2 hypothetical protein PADG_00018 [Paracoccidioides brasiliensis Pb18]